MQFDNIEYFAKTKQLRYECTHALACAVINEGVKRCTWLIRASSFTAWFSRLKCIKSDRKIQDMGSKHLYIYISYDLNHTKSAVFFFKISTITHVILILYNSSINNKLISRDLYFRHHIACFCCISPTKNNSKQLQDVLHLWATWQWFVHEWFNRLNDSVQS